MLRLHEKLYIRTDGRLGHGMIGVPTLLLRTTGRRSCATRTNGLVYARDGDDYLVVASNGGADRPRAWLNNLRPKPDGGIQIARDRQTDTANIDDTTDSDYDTLKNSVNKNNDNR